VTTSTTTTKTTNVPTTSVTTNTTETEKATEMTFAFKVTHVQIPGVQIKITIKVVEEVSKTTPFKIMNVEFNGLTGDLTPVLPTGKNHGQIDTSPNMFAIKMKAGDLYSKMERPTAIEWKTLKVDTDASPFVGSKVELTLKSDAQLWLGNKEQPLLLKQGQKVSITI
jgi:hypothetical protein